MIKLRTRWLKFGVVAGLLHFALVLTLYSRFTSAAPDADMTTIFPGGYLIAESADVVLWASPTLTVAAIFNGGVFYPNTLWWFATALSSAVIGAALSGTAQFWQRRAIKHKTASA